MRVSETWTQRDDVVRSMCMLSRSSLNARRQEYSLALVRECAEDLGGVVLVLLPQLVEQAHVLERGVAALAVEGDYGVRRIAELLLATSPPPGW